MVSGIITAILLVLFLFGWVWVWNPRRQPEFAAAAHEPLNEDDAAPAAAQETRK